MIFTETLNIDGMDLVRTYSDSGKYVVRDGVAYEEDVWAPGVYGWSEVSE